MYCKQDLLSLGFSDRLIKTLLPEPAEGINTHGGTMYIWKNEDVYHAMLTEDFEKYQDERKRRSSASKLSAEKKKAVNLSLIRKTVKITVEKKDYHINDLLRWAKDVHDAGVGKSGRVVLQLCAEIWHYDVIVEGLDLSGMVGKEELADALHEMIKDELSKIYPELAPFFEELKNNLRHYLPFD